MKGKLFLCIFVCAVSILASVIVAAKPDTDFPAYYRASKNRPITCGVLLGTASLIKFFPIGIAMVLGLKNWRIFAGCSVTFSLALLLPGTQEWFSSFLYPPYKAIWYSPVYTHLGTYLFPVYAAVIALLSRNASITRDNQ